MVHKHEHEKHEKSSPKSFFDDPWKVGLSLLVIILLAYIAFVGQPQKPPSGGNNTTINQTPKKANVTLELFVMSQCPYGVQAEGVVKTVIDKFGGEVNLSLYFIANQNSDGTFSSMHGQPEVEEDLRQVCIIKYYPDNLLGYLSCVAGNYSNVGQIWESCASQNKINVNTIKTCSGSDESLNLLGENIKKTIQLNVGSSPTVYLNGSPYGGAVSESSLTKGICALIPGNDVCKNLPPEVSVGLIVINDDACIMCDPSGIESTLRSSFEITNMTVRKVSYSSTEGSALLQKFNITGLPAYVFNSSIAKHTSYDSLKMYLHLVDSSYFLAVPPVKFLNMIEKNDTLQLFVMSQCPYGTMAEKAMKELLDALPGVKFAGLQFIANQNEDGTFSSLHGQPEVEEDLRQVCVIKYYNDKLFNYTLCIAANYSNAGSIWEKCANESKMDVGKIRNCSTGDEGKALLRDNIKLSNSLGIYSSPTILLNNNTVFNAVYAEPMKQAVCAYNPALEGCNRTLSGAGTTAPSGGCG